MTFDFSGYATKNNIRCTDGRVIRKDAFKHLDGKQVPLVWQHQHNDPSNVLGHAVLENREDGVYAYAKFNESPAGLNGKELVKHGDVVALSIYANQLKQNGADVVHGTIREVSLVLSGANPGAIIDNVVIRHSDDTFEELEDEAIIHYGEEGGITMDQTVEELFGTFSEAQKDLTYQVLAHAASGDQESYDLAMDLAEDALDEDQLELVDAMVEHSLESDDDEDEDEFEDDEYEDDEEAVEHSAGGRIMKRNLFAQQGDAANTSTLSHEDASAVLQHAQGMGVGSLRNALLVNATAIQHAATAGVDYGITNIEVLFPEAQNVTAEPDFIKRRTEWVADILGGTKKSPFNRIKSIHADITEDAARARGYIKGKQKLEEVFPLLSRTTTPSTIYKKQKLDRDDIIDITSLDIVRFIKNEMRVMFDEEVARAILIGDGRKVNDESKIKEDTIRPIHTDADLYSVKVEVDAAKGADDLIDQLIANRNKYKGTGTPTLYVAPSVVSELLILKDKVGHRIYKSLEDVARAVRVAKIVEVEVMENVGRTDDQGNLMMLQAIMVNLTDYTVGTNKGGQLALFEDFDIDFNQMKYLMESRMCGALTKPFSAVVFETKPAVAEGDAGQDDQTQLGE